MDCFRSILPERTADDKICCKQQYTGSRNDKSGSESWRFVAENYRIIACVSLYSHEAIGNALDVCFFSVDFSGPAFAVRHTEEYQCRLVKGYLRLKTVRTEANELDERACFLRHRAS